MEKETVALAKSRVARFVPAHSICRLPTYSGFLVVLRNREEIVARWYERETSITRPTINRKNCANLRPANAGAADKTKVSLAEALTVEFRRPRFAHMAKIAVRQGAAQHAAIGSTSHEAGARHQPAEQGS